MSNLTLKICSDLFVSFQFRLSEGLKRKKQKIPPNWRIYVRLNLHRKPNPAKHIKILQLFYVNFRSSSSPHCAEFIIQEKDKEGIVEFSFRPFFVVPSHELKLLLVLHRHRVLNTFWVPKRRKIWVFCVIYFRGKFVDREKPVNYWAGTCVNWNSWH